MILIVAIDVRFTWVIESRLYLKYVCNLITLSVANAALVRVTSCDDINLFSLFMPLNIIIIMCKAMIYWIIM